MVSCFMGLQVEYYERDLNLLGNSKTRLVMAAASSRGIPLISLSAADIYSVYVGL